MLSVGIRSKILEKTYKQCLKLLNPKCREFQRHFSEKPSPLTADEKRALQPSGALLERVQMGSFPLANVTKLSVLPALYVANGTESVEAPTSDPRVGESTLQEVYELFPIVLRLVVHQEVEPKYEESNPITVTSIREQLDYFLDKQSFLNITDKRSGYSLPSRVLRASIVASYTLEGIASPWEVFDFRFEVIFKRQSARD